MRVNVRVRIRVRVRVKLMVTYGFTGIYNLRVSTIYGVVWNSLNPGYLQGRYNTITRRWVTHERANFLPLAFLRR